MTGHNTMNGLYEWTKGEGWSTANLLKSPSNFIAGRPKVAFLFWFFMAVLLSIYLWYVSILATCIAAHFAVCHALYNNKKKKKRK